MKNGIPLSLNKGDYLEIDTTRLILYILCITNVQNLEFLLGKKIPPTLSLPLEGGG